jgi:F-type H+-transporting ATPase subunit g
MLRSSLRPQTFCRSIHTSRLALADAKQSASKAVDSTKQAASKATATAQEYASKAIEQSQRFAKAISNTGEKLLSNAGPRVNGLVDRVAGLQKPIVYWSKVGGEVAKQGMSLSMCPFPLRPFHLYYLLFLCDVVLE